MSTPEPEPFRETVRPIGWVRSSLTDLSEAPRQGDEGAPDSSIELDPEFLPALEGVLPGAAILVLTWLDRADRAVLRTHPRNERSRPEVGVFATRSPDRPNPIGLHRVQVLAIEGATVQVRDLEAIDGTPVVDTKPVLGTDPAQR